MIARDVSFILISTQLNIVCMVPDSELGIKNELIHIDEEI